MMAKAYDNRQGLTPGLWQRKPPCWPLFQWAEIHLISLKAEHLAGAANITADWLSRQKVRDIEWHLNPESFQLLVRRWGLPVLDLFANVVNTQTPKYLTRTPTLGALGADALQFPWPQGLLYPSLPQGLLYASLPLSWE